MLYSRLNTQIQFYNLTDKELSLYHDALYWAKANSTQLPVDPDFTRFANMALDTVDALIKKSDAVWEWDDSNNTDLPIATSDLVANQEDYSVPVTHAKILRVRVKDQGGSWVTLEPVDRRQVSDSELNDSGTPSKYDKIGNSIFPIPKSSYSSTGGIEVQFQRGASYFTTSDTTKTPGFAVQFHRLISLYAALDYTDRNSMDRQSIKIRERIKEMREDLMDYYATRDHDSNPSLRVRKEDYGASELGDSSIPKGFNF